MSDSVSHITPQIIRRFWEDGFVCVENLLTADEVLRYGRAVEDGMATRRTQRSSTDAIPRANTVAEQLTLEINLWEDCPDVRPLTFHQGIAGAAARLLDSERVRLFMDQGLYKEPGAPGTGKHQDVTRLPIDGARLVTAWIPFHDATSENGTLGYVPGSHCVGQSSYYDMLLGNSWSEEEREKLAREPVVMEVPSRSVLFHHGKTFHFSQPNRTSERRRCFSIVFFADDSIRAHSYPHPSVDRISLPTGEPVAGDATPIAYPLSHGDFPPPPPPLIDPPVDWPGLRSVDELAAADRANTVIGFLHHGSRSPALPGMLDCFHAIRPHFTEGLASPQALDALQQAMAQLPFCSLVFLEHRMHDASPWVDLAPRIPRANLVLSGRARKTHAWTEAARVSRAALDASWHIKGIDLEFDLPRALDTALSPRLFLEMHRDAPRGRLVQLARLLHGDISSRAKTATIERCDDALPEDGRILHLCAAPSREQQGPLRVVVTGLDESVLLDYLRAIDWPGDVPAIAEWLRVVRPLCDNVDLAFDIADRVQARVGIELFIAPRRDRTDDWTALFAALRQHGIGRRERTDGFLAWPGSSSLSVPGDSGAADANWEFVRFQSHLKLVHDGVRIVAAKGYIGFFSVPPADPSATTTSTQEMQ